MFHGYAFGHSHNHVLYIREKQELQDTPSSWNLLEIIIVDVYPMPKPDLLSRKSTFVRYIRERGMETKHRVYLPANL